MISKYPVEISDVEGMADAINYLLSGPSGLGQNFDGFSDYDSAVIRPTFFRPFTLPSNTTLDANWYIRMPVTNIVPVPSNPTDKITVTFTPPIAYTNPPFQFGDRLKLTGFEDSGLPTGFNEALNTPTGTKPALATPGGVQYGPVATTTVTGSGYGAKVFVLLDQGPVEPYSSSNTDVFVDIQNVGTGYAIGDTIKVLGTDLGGTTPANDLTLTVASVDSGFYNDNYNVYSSTTTTVDLYTSKDYFWPAITTYGLVIRDYANYPISTDCLAQVAINSVNDRVFITAQVEFSYTVQFESIPPLPAYYTANDWDIVVQVNRYTASLDQQGNTVYNYQDTVSQKILSANYGDAQEGSAIFTTIIDQQLDYGSYAYILELAFVTKPTLGDGTTPGLAGFGSTPSWLTDNGFRTAPLPRGVAVGNFQVQSTPPGTTYTAVVPTIISSVNGSLPLLDVEVNPDLLTPLYTVGQTVNVTLNTTASINNAGFVPGDILKIAGTDIGGASPLNDLYLAVTETDLRSLVIPGTFTMGLRNLTTQVIKE